MDQLRKLRKSFTTILWGGHNFETANLRQPTSYKARRTGRLRGVGVPPGGGKVSEWPFGAGVSLVWPKSGR